MDFLFSHWPLEKSTCCVKALINLTSGDIFLSATHAKERSANVSE